MVMPDWWNSTRLGLAIHATAATVPGWAPIGQEAEWYRAHLGEELDDVILHSQPMIEVLAHHRERWGHIDRYDDFVPLLTFEQFDAEEWARLARTSGAGYSILVAKHHDGWSWWDSPNSARRMTEAGPKRNVLGEFAAACERNGLTFGTHYSLLDWGDDRYPSDDYVTDVLHRDVIDLVERYGAKMLRGDGHWGHDAGHWRTADLLRAVRAIDPDIVINDHWWASAADTPDGAPGIVRTFDGDCPDEITPGPWELCRGVGQSLGYNRNERARHHLTGFGIVDLYTEVLAKGGNLLLGVGPTADGTIPDMQAAPLRDAGTWIRRFDDLLTSCRPWTAWGDAHTRILAGPSEHEVYAIDLGGGGRFAAFDPATTRVVAVEEIGVDGDRPIEFEQHDGGLRLRHAHHHPSERFTHDAIGVAVYRLTIEPADQPIELFDQPAPQPIPLAPLLDEARAGDIVQLGDGEYLGPATVPRGVILRGLGAGRTTIRATSHGIVPPEPAITIQRSARVEHLEVCGEAGTSRSDAVAPILVVLSEDYATLLGCTVRGHVHVLADDGLLRAVTGRGVVAVDAHRLSLSRCTFRGNRWDVGVQLIRGTDHTIESSDITDHLCAIRVTETTGTTVRGNTISARWWGVHLDRTEAPQVHGNHIGSTMRSVDVDGGADAIIRGNASIGGDSGCIVQAGAARCQVSGNHWEDCRIGLLAWDSPDLTHRDNVSVDLHEPDCAAVQGP